MTPSALPVDLSPYAISSVGAMVWAWTTAFAPRVLAAAVILVVGFLFAGWARRGLDRLTVRTHWVDNTIRPFLLGVAQYAVVIIVLILVLNQIGIETSSLLAVLGAAGLAVGLALQGTLSNIAAGIMLLWLRPFRVGDYIEVNGLSGTVVETGLFACTLRTFDGAKLFAPNSTIWNFALRNHSETKGRLLAFSIGLAPDVTREQVQAALSAAMAADPRILQEPKPMLFADSFSAAGTTLTWRLFVTGAAYSELQRTLVDTTKITLANSGIAPDSILSIARIVPTSVDPTKLMDI